MNRDIECELLHWKDDARRLPLLVRGARQVGKSYTVIKFGREQFEDLLEVNFELDPRYGACFDGSLEPQRLLDNVAAVSGHAVTPGRTLLFLDEVQSCPRAILALRYFHEKLPALHVIAAGSLLEFAMVQEDFRMPVGRVQYLFMRPLSFGEFLDAVRQSQARAQVRACLPAEPIPPVLHDHLLAQVRTYLAVGGMPAAVNEYAASGSVIRCGRVQATIAQTYRDDFGKYATRARVPHLRSVFSAIPRMVGRKFKYSAVDHNVQSRELKLALDLLERAGVVYRVKQTSGAGLPLEADADDRNFKVVFLDVGLMQNLCGLSGEALMAEDLLAIHAGAVAEQFVGQELVAGTEPFDRPVLHYWAREARTSNAEVDYLVAHGPRVLPLEVKSGKTGSLRSLHLFLKQYNVPCGIRVAQQPAGYEAPVVSVPLYAMEMLGRLVSEATSSLHA